MNKAIFYVAVIIADLAILSAPVRLVAAHAGESSRFDGETYRGVNNAALATYEPAGYVGQDHDWRDDWRHDMPEREQETIQKSFTLSASAHRSVEVDNVLGSINVVGGPSDQVQLVVNKTIRAESKERLEAARKEVTLDITQKDDGLRLYVNGPFRCGDNDCIDSRGDRGYSVRMDFELQVPREIALRLKGVAAGQISVRNVSGDYSLHTVNGKIEMIDVAGSGTAQTVNGQVKANFREAPAKDSEFRTVNGGIELSFPSNLSADFHFKTLHGEVFTDFPATTLPVHAAREEHGGLQLILGGDRNIGARVGFGGPEIKVETLNGEIRVLKNRE